MVKIRFPRMMQRGSNAIASKANFLMTIRLTSQFINALFDLCLLIVVIITIIIYSR